MLLSLYHDGFGTWENWSRDDRAEDLIHLRARDTVHRALRVPKTRSKRMPESDDLLNTCGIALLRQVIESNRSPFLEATLLAFGREEVVHRKHVLGVQCYGRYRDRAEAGL